MNDEQLDPGRVRSTSSQPGQAQAAVAGPERNHEILAAASRAHG